MLTPRIGFFCKTLETSWQWMRNGTFLSFALDVCVFNRTFVVKPIAGASWVLEEVYG
jgi:hypothetical protein